MTLLLLAKTLTVLGVLLVGLVPLTAWLERRQSALMQDRVGPARVNVATATLGGLLQPLADAIARLAKESVRPRGADRVLHALAPALALVPVIVMVAVIPFGARYTIGSTTLSLVLADADAGVLWFFALSTLSGLGFVLAGWSSNSDYALLGAVRAGAQTVSCQIAMALSLVPMFAIYGTLRLSDMGLVQDRSIGLGGLLSNLDLGVAAEWLSLPAWGIVQNPVCFATFLLCAMAASRQPPFDSSSAGSEIAGGHTVEYSGVGLGLFQLAGVVQLVVIAGIVTAVFLGGSAIPWLSQDRIISAVSGFYGEGFATLICMGAHAIAFLLKLVSVIVLQVVLRGSMPRLRDDQLMDWLWKGMMPLALLNIFATGFVLVAVGGGGG
ncbi:MAG: NADH-quinone oxidoreductase subunit H [Deltaproteobacteria bacterium]|nr:NADH-quinone oxidoreductase subunit H [Deltaproteobacteria bacterium]